MITGFEAPSAIIRNLAGVWIALLCVSGPAWAATGEAGIATPENADNQTTEVDVPLEGRVLDAASKPLAGATVLIRAAPKDQRKDRPASEPIVVRTDENGRFSSGETTGTRFDVRARAEGHAFRTVRQFEPPGPLTLRLERGHDVTGHVLAETSGEGLPGVRVEIDDGKGFDFEGGGFETETDSEGRYRFARAPQGEVWVRATAPGWARRSLRGNVVPGRGEDPVTELEPVWLPKGGRIAGRVTDSKSKPVAGAKVFAGAVDLRRRGGRLSYPPLETWTDDAGRYEIRGITAGSRYRVIVEHEAFSSAVAGPVAIDAGTVLNDLDLTLRAGAALRFRLIDAEDRPSIDVTVRFWSEEEARTDLVVRQWTLSTEEGEIEAGPEGWLTARNLVPGRYTLRLEPDDRVGLWRENVVLTEGETTDLGAIALERGSRIRGRVVDESGTPVADAEVSVHWQDMTGRYERRTKSEGDGRFDIGGMPDHSVMLQARAEGFAERKLEKARAGDDGLVVKLVRRGGIRGTVKLAGGVGAPAFHVRTYDSEGTTTPSGSVEIRDGGFEIRDLDPGRYGVEVRASGSAPGRVEKTVVRSGEVTDVGEVVLRPGLRLEGRVVVAEGGAAVPGATVRVDRGSGPLGWSRETGQLAAVSDTLGEFAFDELTTGRYTLTLFHPEYAPTQRGIDLEASDRKTEIEIGLTSGGEIRGVVIDADGLPVTGANLVIYRGSRAFDLRFTATAADGTFRFPRLAPGTYIVMRNRSRARSPFPAQVRTLEIREGQVKELKLIDPAE